ncbi:hypothetical protein MMC08_000725 [Hypocenomyce scalaris]|nr:hypothetical protein [Hypocenomyce scalaris]
MAQQFPDFNSSSYDSYAPVSTYPPVPSYYAPQLVFNGPDENIKQMSNRYTPQGSPSTSASHPPSTLSSASGASAHSTASSAVGSPYSHATHSLNGHEQWGESSQGLSVAPTILHNDGSFGHDNFVVPSLEHGLFDDEKFSGSFVVDTSASMRGVTIDTILEEANSTIDTPTPKASPGMASSPKPSPPMFQRRMSPPKMNAAFKSPTTPASAMSPYASHNPSTASHSVAPL